MNLFRVTFELKADGGKLRILKSVGPRANQVIVHVYATPGFRTYIRLAGHISYLSPCKTN